MTVSDSLVTEAATWAVNLPGSEYRAIKRTYDALVEFPNDWERRDASKAKAWLVEYYRANS